MGKQVDGLNTERFLDLFEGDMVYCLLDDKRKKPSLNHVHEGYELQREQILNNLRQANGDGFGVFFCVNQIDKRLDPTRHRTSNMIVRCRAVWADMDDPVDEPKSDWPLEPSLIVNTSPGKYHYYWLTSTEDFDQWGQVMNGMANNYGSDANARDLVRVLRLPGFYHHKSEPFKSQVVGGTIQPYDWFEITSAFPPDPNTPAIQTSERGDYQKFTSFKDSVEAIKSGTNYHGAIMWLLNHWVNNGIGDPDELKIMVESVMRRSEVRDNRWLARMEDHYLEANIRDAIKFVADHPFIEDVVVDAVDVQEVQAELSWPPGMMGQLCQEIYEMAPHPNEEIAILSAFTLVAGVSGRTFNVLGAGLNLYTACLARSGIGKAVIKDSINTALRTVGVLNNGPSFIGPARITGPRALLKNLHEHPTRILVMEESGLLSASRAGDNAGISRILLELYTSSGKNQWFGAEAYSNKEDSSAALRSPSVTIAHVSTPESYIRALKSKDAVNSGDLARIWTLRSLRDKSYLNQQRRTEFSPEVAKRIVEILGVCKSNQESDTKLLPKVVDLDTSLIDIEHEDRHWVDIENKLFMVDPVKATIASRASLKVMKIAAVASVFNDCGGKVGTDEYAWAKEAIQTEFEAINTAVSLGAADDIDAVIDHIVIPTITKIINYQYKDKKKNPNAKLKGKGVFSRSNLYQCLKNHQTIKQMDSDTQRSTVAKTGIDKVMENMLRSNLIMKVDSDIIKTFGIMRGGASYYKITPSLAERIGKGDDTIESTKVRKRDGGKG